MKRFDRVSGVSWDAPRVAPRVPERRRTRAFAQARRVGPGTPTGTLRTGPRNAPAPVFASHDVVMDVRRPLLGAAERALDLLVLGVTVAIALLLWKIVLTWVGVI